MCHVKHSNVFVSTVLPNLRQNGKFSTNFLLFCVVAECSNIQLKPRAAVR